MITLAKAGGRSRLLAHVKTPTSPIPPARRPTSATSAAVPTARRAHRLSWGLAAVALGLGVWWLAPWRRWQPPATSQSAGGPSPDTLHPPSRAPTPPLALVPVDTAAALRPESATSRARAKRSPAARVEPPGAAARAPDSSVRPSAQREDSLMRSLHATAVAAMRRALEAGASPGDMAKGDTVFKAADSLAAHGRVSEAVMQLAMAASLWAEAERQSRLRAAAAAPRQAPAEPAPPSPPPPADPRAQIESVIAEYARALESLDLGQVRRAYPGLTPAQQQGWKGFFESIRRLKTGLKVTVPPFISIGDVVSVDTRTGEYLSRAK